MSYKYKINFNTYLNKYDIDMINGLKPKAENPLYIFSTYDMASRYVYRHIELVIFFFDIKISNDR